MVEAENPVVTDDFLGVDQRPRQGRGRLQEFVQSVAGHPGRESGQNGNEARQYQVQITKPGAETLNRLPPA